MPWARCSLLEASIAKYLPVQFIRKAKYVVDAETQRATPETARNRINIFFPVHYKLAKA
jgi:hypothetical protein